MSENKTIKIDNFNLNLFDNLLQQSLMVTSQLMLEFKGNIVKSCSFSSTKSLIKLLTIPISNFIVKDKENLDVEPSFNLEYDFNFYILKGDLFKKYISVFKQDKVSLEFSLKMIDGKYQATSIKIVGYTANDSLLETTFALTSEELISNQVSDYNEIIKEATPSNNMFQFILVSEQLKEIKALIRNLHKSAVDNTAFLSFEITNETIKIYDKVFNVNFKISDEVQQLNKMNNVNEKEIISFNILKSDFVFLGETTFKIFTENSSDKVIFASKYLGAMVMCLTTKVTTSVGFSDAQDDIDSIDSLDINEYLDL